MSEERDPHQPPGIVIAAVAAGTVVVPFLIVYSFLFIARGFFVEVEQPDITSSRQGEGAAGFVALAFLVFVLWGMMRLLNGSNRVAFWIGQLITLVASLKFLLDSSSGDPQVPAATALAALLAIGLSLSRPANRWAASAGGERPAGERPAGERPAGERPADADISGEPDAGLGLMTEPTRQQG